MTAKTDKAVSTNVENKTPKTVTEQETTARQIRKMRPMADIHETKEGVTLYIDLPGVSKDALEINIDQNVLTIEGELNLNTPDDLQPTYMDVNTGVFSRQFTLSAELDSTKIAANLVNGVLKLNIPRSEKHKPRKIEVKAV
jgi:HSP20 family molecular chaperone IbpA